MPRVFISYRRAESQSITDRIHDRLAQAFGEHNVFQDVIDIKYGLDFRRVLQEQVSTCDILLIVIGPTWATTKETDTHTGEESGQFRLFNPDDFVRIETETGIRRKDILTIPVLVNGASLPNQNTLPESLRPLAYLNAITIRNNPYFDEDIHRLITRLREYERERKYGRSAFPLPVALLAGLIVVALGVVVVARLLNPPQENLSDLTTEAAAEAVSASVSPALLLQKVEPSATDVTLMAAVATLVPSFTPTDTPAPFPTKTAANVASAPPLALLAEGIAEITPVARNEDWRLQATMIADVEMVLVPPGRFFMAEYSEQVFNESFWISSTEITNAQYRQCVEMNGCTPPAGGEIFDEAYANYPVASVDWYQARDYAEWHGGRLPTEAEWEYAARGPDQWNYPWGNEFDGNNVVYGGNSGGLLAPVRSRSGGMSWVGAFDMSGNLSEWTSTICYDPSGASRRIIRGGDYGYNSEDRLTTHYRYGSLPDDERLKGFRIVRGQPPQDLPTKPCPPLL